MTQPDQAVGGEPSADSDATQAFEDIAATAFENDEEDELPEEGEQAEPDSAEESDDEPELEAEDEELPPIDPPVSWDADAKAKFAELPRDVQEYVAKREGEREKFVQQKSQEATRARQEVEQSAYQQLAAYERSVSEHLNQLASQVIPQRPNPALLHHDPATFYAQQAEYENAVAQQQQLQQQANQYASQAQERQAQAEQAFHAEQRTILTEQFPEYLDPTTGPDLARKLSAVARELGYPPELIAEARATDIIAMRKVSEAMDKASRYDALMAKKMEKVRSAKGLPKVAKPGVAQGNDQLRARNAQAAWEVAKSAKSRPAKDEALAEWMKNTGWL